MRSARYVLWLVLFAVSIEVAVRVDDWITFRAPIFKNFNQESLVETDALGKRGKPYAHYLKWKLNSLGFRGPELRPDGLRIGTVGSSETFGLYESIDHEWPRELEQSLNSRPGPVRIEVVNFAFAGMLVSTFEKRLPEFIQLTSPQVVIIYPSIVGELYRTGNFGPKPKANGKTPTPPASELRIKYRAETIFKNNAPHWLIDWLRERRALRVFADTPLVMERAPDSLLDTFREDIKRVIFGLRADGVVPVLVTHATYFGPRLDSHETPMMINWRQFYPMLKEEGFLDMEARANAILKEIALSEHLILIDAAAKMPEGGEFFADFVHFTDRGSRLFSELIAGRLQCLRQQGTECLADARTQPSQPKSPHSFQ
ncbi:MAG: SGNH/GDSL hydrolase family protein [Proteobacteria bacterium]|nr:SGNH/GDSL hydrolase family protein [Pseudomonadota bacterium]